MLISPRIPKSASTDILWATSYVTKLQPSHPSRLLHYPRLDAVSGPVGYELEGGDRTSDDLSRSLDQADSHDDRPKHHAQAGRYRLPASGAQFHVAKRRENISKSTGACRAYQLEHCSSAPKRQLVESHPRDKGKRHVAFTHRSHVNKDNVVAVTTREVVNIRWRLGFQGSSGNQ